MFRVLVLLAAWAALLVVLPDGTRMADAAPKSEPAAKNAPAPEASGLQIPDGPVLSVLIRRTLLALNDANLTGNYTVLRDLAAPGFQAANDAAKLAAIFTNLRERQIDLSPIIYFDPKLVREPQINENGMLRVSGFIPTQPEQVNFDMMFQLVSGRWRIFGLAVNTSPTAGMPTTATAAPKTSAKPAPEAAKKSTEVEKKSTKAEKKKK